MKQLIVMGNPRVAQAYVDYMAVLKIECQLAAADQGVAVFLKDEQHLEKAEYELKQFLENPNDEKYLAASWTVADSRKASFSYGGKGIVKSAFFAHAGPVTLIVLLIAGLVYLLMNIGFDRYMMQHLTITPQLSMLASEQFWRVITPIFLHFSVIHIVFNGLWWWQLGGEIERQLGSSKLLLITLVAAVIPNVAQLLATGPYFGGLSGVVYALLGYCWFTGWLRPQAGLQLSPAIVGFMLVWLVIGFMDVIGPSTANLAHLFGLFVGCAQAVLDRFVGKQKQA
ncbi:MULTISPECIES: rhomboid family intramembrane serine protease GlpG [unclassified Agarivorans]|uniref:rhomboid family intramembrane serine protease GlpG n=1 Tax=unclassified Agarivorans TaxID=2636026 RepID=UPI0026E416AB|nr:MULTISPECIES: rhomboid family intramembrane serine protease GlpG [unclassified Agarivorans]MDO6687561.1 rhomboid family intramembrane serine protease GlpG [Agarivorans sp. 3_MG-2023]MDO6717106.1 rhomboid family intramembrane serine protease GlpG [Agarivorans sp. 2_MG-2023]